jgi:hypothetical protein
MKNEAWMMDTFLMAVSGAHCRGPLPTPAVHPALSHTVSISCVRRHTSYSFLARPVFGRDNSYGENEGGEERDT